MHLVLGFSFLIFTFSVSTSLQAPIPPESLSLVELSEGDFVVDPAYEAWERSVNEVQDPEDIPRKTYEKYRLSLTETERVFSDLKRLSLLKKSKRKSFVSALERKLEDEAYWKELKEHRLFPDLLNEAIETDYLSDKAVARYSKEISSWAGNICPKKELILRTLEKDERDFMPLDEVKDYLVQIQKFNSQRFQKIALGDLMELTDEERHKDVKEELAKAISPYSRLINDHNWVVEGNSEKEILLEEPHKSFTEVSDSIKRRRCSTAKKQLIKGIKSDSDKKHLMKVSTLTNKVEQCFRRRGRTARIRFLSHIKKYLKEQYGFEGEEVALRRKALVYWSRDKFDQSREILDYLATESSKIGNDTILARTIYTLARVDENEGKLEKAIESYGRFVDKFPDDEKGHEAKSSLIMLHTIQGNQKLALEFAEGLINSETVEEVNERDSSTLSFALFWAGKLSLHLGDTVKSKEYWRRLASEYYSTFYGAFGHYMLEQMLGKRLVLQPARVPRFNKEQILSAYKGEGKETVARIEAMLKIGLKGDASCEAKELVTTADDHEKNLVKAMYLYASGDWLDAIKKYVKLPRSFRHSLPRGMERLLFPKNYSKKVQNYAKRLGVDPDYVFAIIRQESVFNPSARSPVGAAGLMQLMPATARLESRSLRRGYVGGKQKKALIRKARKKRIYDAETNLALGIHHVYRLFKKYKSPIHVLTSYNANPTATRKWMENIDSSVALAYVERIPYRETRAYVKLVMRNYFYYKRWYRKVDEPSPFMDYLAPKSIELAKASQEKKTTIQ